MQKLKYGIALFMLGFASCSLFVGIVLWIKTDDLIFAVSVAATMGTIAGVLCLNKILR